MGKFTPPGNLRARAYQRQKIAGTVSQAGYGDENAKARSLRIAPRLDFSSNL
jgi:hypothetical protein